LKAQQEDLKCDRDNALFRRKKVHSLRRSNLKREEGEEGGKKKKQYILHPPKASANQKFASFCRLSSQVLRRIGEKWAKQWDRERTSTPTKRLTTASNKKMLWLYDSLLSGITRPPLR
jgi:hypothetical protein